MLCCLMLLAVPLMLRAGTVTPLREGWQLQSACKLQAAGDSIATAAFQTDGWLKTAVPSTVLAAQAAAGVFPDPYYGMNLRQIPGTTYPIGAIFANLPMAQDSPYRCGWWYRNGVYGAGPIACGRAPVAALWRHQLSRRNLAERPQDCGLQPRWPEPIEPTTST